MMYNRPVIVTRGIEKLNTENERIVKELEMTKQEEIRLLFRIPLTMYFLYWSKWLRSFGLARKVFRPQDEIPYRWRLI